MDETPQLRISGTGCGALLCFGFGGLLVFVALYWMASAWLSAPNWATVEGQVVEAGVDSSTHKARRIFSRRRYSNRTYDQTRFNADVIYRYSVNGEDHTGFGIGDGVDWSYTDRADAIAALRPYATGRRVTVYYDPRDPERSCLDTSLFGVVPWLIAGLGGLLILIAFWLRALRREEVEEAGEGSEAV